MNILHVISSSGMYGAESVIVNLCTSLNAERHRSDVAVFLNHSKPNLDLHRTCQQYGIASHLIPSNGKIDWSAVRAIKELAFSTAVDVVHAHGYKADVFVHLALRRSKFPYVATCHNWIDDDFKARFYGYVDRWILSGYSRIAAVSEEVAEILHHSGVDRNRIVLIRNGIDVRPFLHAPCGRSLQTDLVIGFAGRLSWEKGPDIFLRAARKALQHQDRLEFVLAGDGPELSTMQQLAHELGIADKIRLLRHVKDMASFYHGLDIMVSPSRREGLPIALLEGMASGLPVIATSVGDVPKVIDHGRTGLLVPPDDPQTLAQTIVGLVEDRLMRSQLGIAARRFVSDVFSADRMARDYLELYEKAMLDRA